MQLPSHGLINIVKVLPFGLQQCFDPLDLLSFYGPLKNGFLDIYLRIFFGARTSGNTSATRVIFFCEMYKI